MFNQAKGVRFHAELFSLLRDNNLVFDFDVFDEYSRVIFDECSILTNDVLSKLFNIAYRFDLLVEITADNNSIVVNFYLN